jgi:hypothetical protein
MFFRKKGSKFSNVKTGKYDSKKESKRAGELQLLLKAGIIKELEEQKVFVLQETFKARATTPPHQLETIRSIKYIADFYYYDNEKKVYVAEDVKGFKTLHYIIKSKLFRKIYENILFIEIMSYKKKKK